jgi:hypothetical protein
MMDQPAQRCGLYQFLCRSLTSGSGGHGAVGRSDERTVQSRTREALVKWASPRLSMDQQRHGITPRSTRLRFGLRWHQNTLLCHQEADEPLFRTSKRSIEQSNLRERCPKTCFTHFYESIGNASSSLISEHSSESPGFLTFRSRFLIISLVRASGRIKLGGAHMNEVRIKSIARVA